MRRYLIYFAVTLLAFIIGCFVAAVSYLNININSEMVEVSGGKRYQKQINETIDEIEAENVGFEELINAKDGAFITIQGVIDIKFLCHDVTFLQDDVCTTVLMGEDKKTLVIRLKVCSDLNKLNCIVWKPNNLCADNELCSNRIKIYDKNSNPREFASYSQQYSSSHGKQIWVYELRSLELKVTGKVSKIEGKTYLKNPIDFIEFIEN